MNGKRLVNSYILCGVWFFGLAGLQRLYNGKVGTGLLWLCTWGFFGVGQFVDLFMIPSMVEEHDLKLRARHGLSPNGVPLSRPAAIALTATHPTYDKLMVKLLKAARDKGGKISVTQGVLDTGASFAEVEAVLKQMVKSGYASVDNHPRTGAVIYHFLEL
jgi:hypothetical protein